MQWLIALITREIHSIHSRYWIQPLQALQFLAKLYYLVHATLQALALKRSTLIALFMTLKKSVNYSALCTIASLSSQASQPSTNVRKLSLAGVKPNSTPGLASTQLNSTQLHSHRITLHHYTTHSLYFTSLYQALLSLHRLTFIKCFYLLAILFLYKTTISFANKYIQMAKNWF